MSVLLLLLCYPFTPCAAARCESGMAMIHVACEAPALAVSAASASSGGGGGGASGAAVACDNDDAAAFVDFFDDDEFVNGHA